MMSLYNALEKVQMEIQSSSQDLYFALDGSKNLYQGCIDSIRIDPSKNSLTVSFWYATNLATNETIWAKDTDVLKDIPFGQIVDSELII